MQSRYLQFIACGLLMLLFAGCNSQPAPTTQSPVVQVAPNVTNEEPDDPLYRFPQPHIERFADGTEIRTNVRTLSTRVMATEDETWDAMFLQGQKIGYGKTKHTQRFGNDESTRVVTWSSTQQLRLKRFGQITEQAIHFESQESEYGDIYSLKCSLSGGQMNMETTGEVREGFLELTISTQGRKSTKSIPWEKGTGGFFAVEQSLRNKPLMPGEKRQIKWFQPIVNQFTTDDLEALAEEEVALLDGRRKLLKIKSESKFSGQKIVSFFWMDPHGNILRSVMPGMMQEVYRTTKEIATEPSEGSFDLGRSSVVKVNKPLPNHVDLERVVYLAKLKASNPAEVFPACLSQTVQVMDEHTAKITVRKITPQQPEKLTESIPPPIPADSAANNLIQSEDENVRKLAKQVAPNETDAWQIALVAEQFVNQKLNKKNFSQGFATAAEVAKNLEGDCTEHAVLLAAICRAKKLPARVAAGLVYYAPEKGFAYHMWNEVWIRDRWVPLDATLARGGIGGGHIKLFDSNLDGADAFSAFLPVIHVLGQLELEVLEVEEGK